MANHCKGATAGKQQTQSVRAQSHKHSHELRCSNSRGNRSSSGGMASTRAVCVYRDGQTWDRSGTQCRCCSLRRIRLGGQVRNSEWWWGTCSTDGQWARTKLSGSCKASARERECKTTFRLTDHKWSSCDRLDWPVINCDNLHTLLSQQDARLCADTGAGQTLRHLSIIYGWPLIERQLDTSWRTQAKS